MRPIYRLIFYGLGWKIKGDIPKDLKKYIVVVGPHTSNFDFPLLVMVRSILRLSHIRYLAKKSVFQPPFGFIFRKLGGTPVDRSKYNNLVEAVTAIFDAHDKFATALAPEGTRSKVERLKTGFYHIAKKAGASIVPVGMDYTRKIVYLEPPF